MKRILYVDIETYSSVDIAGAGAYKYIESPDFEILIIGYAIDDSEVSIIDLAQGEKIPDEFMDALLDPGCIKVAHNAVFERLSFERIGLHVPIEQWYCTSVKSAYCGLPLSLDGVSQALNLRDKKLSTGKLLIKYFSCPCKPTKVNGQRTRNYPWHAPEKWEMYKEYNMYDVLAEREIYKRLECYELPETERELYALDQRINDNGILVDTELAEAAIYVDSVYTGMLTDTAKKLTGLENPNSGAQIKKWIEDRTGEEVQSLSKVEMPALLEKFKGYAEVSNLLSVRNRLSKTSIKKYYAMLNCAMSDGRVRGTLQFYGANRTGRWAGRLLQMQNMAKNHVPEIEALRELIRKRDWEAIELMYDDVPDILSQLVRTALVAPEGKLFSVADFSAIEARVISWLANEKWRMDVFAGDGKIYEATGSKMFNVPVSAITKGSALRDKSKISELALGYGGALGALTQMGGSRMGLSDQEMMSLVRKWRAANPCIVQLWDELEKSAKAAVRFGISVTCTPRNLVIEYDGEYMTIKLPSGRKLFYYRPRVVGSSNSLVYQGVIQETRQWGEIPTYGGKLTENVVQAIARDLLGHSMLELYANGYLPVCHIHDEVLVEVPKESAKEHYARMVALMDKSPEWAKELPLRADGYLTPFYLKD